MVNDIKEHKKYPVKNSYKASDIVANIAVNSNAYISDDLMSVFKTPDSFGFQVILNMIIEDIINNETNDIDEDLAIINDLKVLVVPFEFDEQYLDLETRGMYYDEKLNILFVNHDGLFENNEKINSNEYYYTLSKNLIHAINDIRQVSIDDTNYLKYSAIFTSMFMEDASTRYPQIYNKYDISDDFSYITDKDQNLLLLYTLFDKEQPRELYNAIFDEDTKKVFNLLNLNTNDDIYDFYRVMYSVDAPVFKNEFFLNYKKDYCLMYEDIGYSYKETVYNHYMINLLNYLKENNLSLEENLTMYYLAMNLIDIKKSHYHYLKFISSYYNIPLDKINDIYESDIRNNILALQKDFGFNIKDVSNYRNKFPMLKLYSHQAINVEGYNNIIDYDKKIRKK